MLRVVNPRKANKGSDSLTDTNMTFSRGHDSRGPSQCGDAAVQRVASRQRRGCEHRRRESRVKDPNTIDTGHSVHECEDWVDECDELFFRWTCILLVVFVEEVVIELECALLVCCLLEEIEMEKQM